MLQSPTPSRVCILATTILLLFQANVARAVDPGDLEKAKEKLQKRISDLKTAGWKPKSKTEQLLTGHRVKNRYYKRSQLAAAQKSEFQQAKADAYMELSKHYMRIGWSYTGYVTTPSVDYRTGEVTNVTTRTTYFVTDPLAAAIAARWGDEAARFNGYAAAQRYRANTIYAAQIQNIESRIRSLEEAVAQEKYGAR